MGGPPCMSGSHTEPHEFLLWSRRRIFALLLSASCRCFSISSPASKACRFRGRSSCCWERLSRLSPDSRTRRPTTATSRRSRPGRPYRPAAGCGEPLCCDFLTDRVGAKAHLSPHRLACGLALRLAKSEALGDHAAKGECRVQAALSCASSRKLSCETNSHSLCLR